MSSPVSKGILWGLSPGSSQYSLSCDLGQRILYSKPQARAHSFHGLLGISKMPTASVIPLHQKLLGGTVKAIIHHPTDFAGVQWDVLCNFLVLHLTGQKNLTYICVCVYFCPAVHMQVWTHDQCFIWTSPKRAKGGVWSSKRYTKSRILKTPRDPPLQTLLCSVNVLWKIFVLHFTRHCIYICPAV